MSNQTYRGTKDTTWACSWPVQGCC